MKKTFEIINRRDDSVIVKENKTLVEISAQIDTENVCFRTVYHGAEIEYHARLLTHENDTLARWVSWKDYISELAYIAAIKQLTKNMLRIKRDLKAGKLHPAWDGMKAIVDSDVKHFRADFFYHDTLRLARENPNTFVWLVRDSGTWLLTETKSDVARSILKYKEPRTIYNVSGSRIEKV